MSIVDSVPWRYPAFLHTCTLLTTTVFEQYHQMIHTVAVRNERPPITPDMPREMVQVRLRVQFLGFVLLLLDLTQIFIFTRFACVLTC